MGLIDASVIEDGGLVTVDSAPIIYLLDGNSKFTPHFMPIFQDIEKGRIRAVISSVTIAEVLSGPLKQGNEVLADRYYRALTSGEGWTVHDLNSEISFLSARIRVQYRLKLPDAIQIATAIDSGSSALVTHDRDFKEMDEIPVLGI